MNIDGRPRGRAEQDLLASTLLEALEVAAKRGAHVVEMALLPHDLAVPGRSTESS